MLIDAALSSLPVVLSGVAMAYFSDVIADFFRNTGSTSLIRGLDNPWTFKTVGWAIIIGYPLYALLGLYMISLGH